MSIENNVPEIRFKGFHTPWSEETIQELIDRLAITSHLDGNHGELYPRANEFTDSGIPYISANDFVTGFMSFSGCKYLPTQRALQFKKGIAKDGDILFAHNATVGPVAKLSTSYDFVILSTTATYFRCDNKTLINDYLLYALSSKNFVDQYSRVMAQSTRNQVPITVQRKFSVSIPGSSSEQTAIGSYFQKLDALINQHQQKHDKLCNIKKAMLEKMFPKQGETVPEIRFKGFSGEWEDKPFGTCFANVPNNTLSRAELNYRAGLAKNIHYGDVLIKFGETLDADSELIPFITNNDVANKLKHTALQSGDIVIADAAEDNTVGKCIELLNVGELLVFSGLHTIAVRPTLPFASKYLGYYLNSASYHDQLSSLMQGTKVLSISKTAIQNTLVVFPNNVEEQAAIGNYFEKLDALINQHQQQITKLNNIKQACLSKMFV
ncbi:restriction endonuclease subunit S [Vibrio mimicus]